MKTNYVYIEDIKEWKTYLKATQFMRLIESQQCYKYYNSTTFLEKNANPETITINRDKGPTVR